MDHHLNLGLNPNRLNSPADCLADDNIHKPEASSNTKKGDGLQVAPFFGNILT